MYEQIAYFTLAQAEIVNKKQWKFQQRQTNGRQQRRIIETHMCLYMANTVSYTMAKN